MEAVFEIVGVLSLSVVSALLGGRGLPQTVMARTCSAPVVAANKSLILEFCAGGYQSS